MFLTFIKVSKEFCLFVTHIIPLEKEGSIVICDGTGNLTKYGSRSGTR